MQAPACLPVPYLVSSDPSNASTQVLTGEMEPTTGTVWKHPNMRFAYVAQHAFHHIEQHLDKTPNQYIQWRYATGEDRENLVKVNRIVTKDEQAAMEKLVLHDGIKKQVDKLLSRCASCRPRLLRACASSLPAEGHAGSSCRPCP